MTQARSDQRKIDNYWNRYDAAKKYDHLLMRDGYGMQASEINEIQSILEAKRRKLAAALFKDGDIISGASIVVDPVSGHVTALAGEIFLDGQLWDVDGAEFDIPVTGTVAVGVRLVSTTISENEDPSLRNPAIGHAAEGEPGAWRLKIEAFWGFDGDGGEGDFFPVYTVDDGVQRAKEAPPALDSFNQALARYDRDSTGTGTYAVSGLTVAAGADLEDGRQVYHLAEGRARVGGIGVELATSRRIIYPAAPDLRTIGMEIVDATAAAGTEDGQRVDFAHTPVQTVHSLRITVEETFQLVHGAYLGCMDDLPVTGVISIEEVKQADAVYDSGTDYVKKGDQIDWSPSGSEPAAGSTYSARVRYLKDIEPEALDLDGFTIKNAVPGTQVLFSYDQMLPRYDRMAMDSEGLITWFKGVASERNPVRPAVPTSLLPLATIYQDWRPGRTVATDSPRVMPFEDIAAIQTRLDYIWSEVARNRLETDISTREAGGRVGMFSDPLLDDTMRDQGIKQTGAVFDGDLTLPILDASSSLLSADIKTPQVRPYTLKTLIEQPCRTGEMQVNPYMAFDRLPALVDIVPAIDQWTETQTSWTSAITQSFTSGWGNRSRLVSSSTTTQLVSSSTSDLQFLREIPVKFEVSGFGPGEKLASATFDSVDLMGQIGAKTADQNGAFSGEFTIPGGIPAGSKLVEFKGQGGTLGSAVFVGQGTLTVQILRNVTTYNYSRYQYDPLAQTFVLDRQAMIGGIDLWFTKKKTQVRVQIRTVENGMPTRTVLAEAVLNPGDISIGTPTRALFPTPVILEGGADYAFIVLCDDPETSLSLATAGDFDIYQQKFVSAQPYAIGVLLSSSNASTWTSHQTQDLTFRLLEADFGDTTDRVIDLGSATLSAATDIILRSLSDIPTAACRCEYELSLPDGTSVTVADGQSMNLGKAVSGQVGVKARLSGDAASSAILYPGSQLLSGTCSETGDYYGRTIPATGATRAVLIYDANIPSGAGVKAQIQLDRGEWQDMTQSNAVRGDNGFVEFTMRADLSNVNEIKARFILTGTPAARPVVQSIRLSAMS